MTFESIFEVLAIAGSLSIGAIAGAAASTVASFLLVPAQTTAVILGLSALITYCDSKVKKKRLLRRRK